MLAIDRHAWTNRWGCRHPLEKLVPAGGMLLVALILPPWPTAVLVIAVMLALTVVGAGVPLRAALGTLAVPLGFLVTGIPVLALAVDVSDGLHVGLAPGGLRLAAEVTLRSLAATSCLVFLILTTPVAELVPMLGRLGVPRPVRELILLIYRLIFVFLERASSGGRLRSPALAMTGRAVASARSAGWPAACFSARLTGGGGLRRGWRQGASRGICRNWAVTGRRLVGGCSRGCCCLLPSRRYR